MYICVCMYGCMYVSCWRHTTLCAPLTLQVLPPRSPSHLAPHKSLRPLWTGNMTLQSITVSAWPNIPPYLCVHLTVCSCLAWLSLRVMLNIVYFSYRYSYNLAHTHTSTLTYTHSDSHVRTIGDQQHIITKRTNLRTCVAHSCQQQGKEYLCMHILREFVRMYVCACVWVFLCALLRKLRIVHCVHFMCSIENEIERWSFTGGIVVFMRNCVCPQHLL